ncbi:MULTISPECIES: hypothetical protein [Pantoea]|uniref:Uncharacterized protein n=1 Tax=Candidatus Pantoea gossypiicola TaxID=2608008 RepID=A0AB34CMD6_9GAMM|nr:MULTISPECIES: hypothetical protein [Pantoea]KAA5931527.1 hypothetical protein F3I59_05485 [Pantoea sp. VH_8]KAA5936662.1 hypothetical protein F3I58_05515 [Pantoea sp. VH_4]KAA5957768.1 hypothetical protein F3I53_16085 [Pantoea sp. VH_16]KAA5987932.1 hypothetical protein F3I49_05405 [Pantoea sp. M_4]KAA6104674.1 hypothetical protein F3I25_16365 [Pantoea sp. Bo_14]
MNSANDHKSMIWSPEDALRDYVLDAVAALLGIDLERVSDTEMQRMIDALRLMTLSVSIIGIAKITYSLGGGK